MHSRFENGKIDHNPSVLVESGEPGDAEILAPADEKEDKKPWAHLLAGGYDLTTELST